MAELIGIREAARRIGVSDTAVRKAIAAGRVTVASHTPHSNRPLLEWPKVAEDWQGNSDTSKRSHYGARTAASPQATAEAPRIRLPKSSELPPAEDDDAVDAGDGKKGPTYAQSRAVREMYQSQLAKLEYEEKNGQLVSVHAVRDEAFKVHRKVRDAMLNLPDRLAPELAAMDDQAEIHILLSREINAALRMLSTDIYTGRQD